MLDRVLAWLTGGDGSPSGTAGRRPDALELALAALLVEAAHSDDHFDESERGVVARLLQRRFRLSGQEARQLLAAAEATADRSTELFGFTRVINERLSPAQRIELIEMLWEVAYADGVLDKFEDSLLRRIGGLIYVDDRERGMARRRVLERHGLADPD